MARSRLRTPIAGACAVALLAAVAACSGSSGSTSSSGGKPTITIWNDALAVGSCGVPASQSFLTKGVNLFLKTNPGFNVKIIQTVCDGSTAFSTLLKTWHQLIADGLTNSDAPSLTCSSGIADFAAGKAAMTITGGFFNSQFMKGLGSKVGLFPVPVLPGSQFPKSLSGGPNNSYVVFKASKNIADDVKLIKFLTSLQVQQLSVDELAQLPNNTSFTPSAQFQASQPAGQRG